MRPNFIIRSSSVCTDFNCLTKIKEPYLNRVLAKGVPLYLHVLYSKVAMLITALFCHVQGRGPGVDMVQEAGNSAFRQGLLHLLLKTMDPLDNCEYILENYMH